MAAGWNGSYRENGFRSRDGEGEVSWRRERDDGGSGRQRRPHRHSRAAEREAGEVSSASVSPVTLSGVENGETSKKRKFSPIIWDLDDDKRASSVSSRIKNKSGAERQEPVVLPLPPPVATTTELVRESIDRALPSEAGVSVDSPEDRVSGGDRVPGHMVEEDENDYVPNISTSRWADGNTAIEDDEADAEREVVVSKKTAVDSRPEIKEVLREGSGGSASKSSSEGGQKDNYTDEDIDGDERIDVASGSSDTDSENSNGSGRVMVQEDPPHRSINMLLGCRNVDEYEWLNKIDEGTYGVVFRAKDRKSGEIVALKKVKMEREREGFPLTSLREINILLSLHHPSIVDVKEVVVGSSLDKIFMVMEYMEHDLKGLMETMKQPFSQSEVKCLMLQLLKGVKYLHQNWVLHRDLKTSNILLNNRGELKICDFGLSRQYGIPLKPYTQLVVTLWYRAPELLLGAKEYSTAIDIWSLGCIMAELLAKEPLFPGKSDFDQLDKMFKMLGTPSDKIWPGFSSLPVAKKVKFVNQQYNKLREKFPPTSFSGRPTLSEAGFDLLNKLLTYDPEKRITADDALNHQWFHEVPLPKSQDFMPTFPAQHAQDRRLRRIMKSPDPLEEQRRRELQGGFGTGSIFD